MTRMREILAVLTAIVVLVACTKSNDTVECPYRETSFTVPAAEIQKLSQYVDSVGVQATQDSAGYFYEIIQPGSGAAPGVCSNISFTYVGKLTNGNTFDSSNTPVSAVVGQLIGGWQLALKKIGTGGRMKLYLPPSLAFGGQARTDNAGNIVIPANSIVTFDLTLTGVN